jgi:chromosome segregation protein
MRLSKIKLSGFKTFVEPTTLTLPSNLVGIVGPNGCGKSNVIDAVRWVLGESSAKYLRGESMSDVIFNGSSTRKPVSNASIELFFDNSQKKLMGEFSKYNEISTRRVITRDGQSEYFLNGTKCRRKDITNLFLGTGLGPRSYAIVQQAMISSLIEAKPDEMRVFIEEASGISKYKQKRKETASRIKNTRENLNRLNDLKDEIDKQLKRLQKQANDAERYKKLKEREKDIEGEIIYCKIDNLNNKIKVNDSESKSFRETYDNRLTKLRKIEADIEELRIKNNEVNEAFNLKQKDHFEIQASIARIEQSIEYEKELESQKSINAQEIKREFSRIKAEHAKDQLELDRINEELQIKNNLNDENKISLSILESELEESSNKLLSEEDVNEILRTKLNDFNTVYETESVRVNLLEKQSNDQNRQKEIIINIHKLEDSFLSLKSIVEDSINKFDLSISEPIRSGLNSLESKIKNLKKEYSDTEIKIKENEKQLSAAISLSKEAKKSIDELTEQKNKSDQNKMNLSNLRNTNNQKIISLREKVQNSELKVESLKTSQQGLLSAISRLEAQITQLKAKSLELSSKEKPADQTNSGQKIALEELLNQSLESEKQLEIKRKKQEEMQTVLRNQEVDRTNLNAGVNQAREDLEEFKLKQKEYEVRKESFLEQLSSMDKDLESIQKSNENKKISLDSLSSELDKILRGIDRLGAINLAAESEYKEENKRIEKLEAQFDDLNRALDTLTGAIKQIDDESKTRFTETFTKVNEGLAKHFPRLFDGGEAYLELEDNDALNGGVFVMARPPGKRNSNIHLLSGGEKALTAVALLFSIFELNPAPFCLLDEVDAPLDDTNVSRFCEIVKEMSSNVQFVVITHNKTTMELTKQLIGVTMSEPGVSRLVSVGLDEAIELSDQTESS